MPAPESRQISGRPDDRLRGGVLSYTAYVEHSDQPLRRLEAPFAGIPVILSLGPSILIDGVPRQSFVAGLDDAATHTEFIGEQRGIQVNLTPLAARRLLGLPMSELTRRVVAIEDLLGARGEELIARLHDASGWHQRFALLDEHLLGRLVQAAPVAAEVEHAWARLQASHGAVAIGALVQEVGWSRRHLTARFAAEVGLPPKTVARILRFARVTRALHDNCGRGLADLAYACGYADQAHLNRDFRAFAGTTPSDYVSRLLPSGGVADGEFPNVQDSRARAA